jgi:hypothetical protein
VVQVALAVVAAMAVVRPLPQWSELPQVRMWCFPSHDALILHDGYIM